MTKVQSIIVNGVLRRGDTVLLAKRAATKKIAPGKWHLPGGYVEFGEDPTEALKREFKEEFDLDIRVGQPIRTFGYTIGNTHTVGISYEIFCDALPEQFVCDPSDNECVEFVTLSDLDTYLTPDDYDYTTLSPQS